MKKNRKILIACATIVEEALPFMPKDMDHRSVDAIFHTNPKKLHAELQKLLNEVSSDKETIILGYGLCSKSVIGLMSTNASLVVPRIDDCISLFLGSQDRYRKLLSENIGTYYLSPGWIKAGATLVEEIERVEKQYGEKNAEIVRYEMLKNYTHLAFINMQSKETSRYHKFAKHAANKLKLSYKEIHGSTVFIKKMLYGPWDDQFVIAAPGQIISYEDFI